MRRLAVQSRACLPFDRVPSWQVTDPRLREALGHLGLPVEVERVLLCDVDLVGTSARTLHLPLTVGRLVVTTEDRRFDAGGRLRTDGLDNAMMESFWSSMQIELLDRRR